MNHNIRTVLFFVFLNAALLQVYAQDKRVITTGVPFLTITPDARAAAMGDIGVATTPDAYSQHWNASKYAFSEKKYGVGFSYTPYLVKLVNDIALLNASFYNKIDDRSAWAASLKYFTLGKVETITEAQFLLGVDAVVERPNEFSLDASYSLKLSRNFSMGVTGRYVVSDLKLSVDDDTRAARSFAVDVSGYYQSDEFAFDTFNGRYRAGFSISNIGQKIKYNAGGQESFLPANLKLGGSFDFILDAYNKITVSTEFNKLLVPTPQKVIDYNKDGVIDQKDVLINNQNYRDISFFKGAIDSFSDAPDGMKEELQEITWALGAEYWYQDAFALRAGYFNESQEKGARQFYTLGAGFKFKAATIDLSYLFSASKVRSPLENTLRFSLTFNFGDSYQNN